MLAALQRVEQETVSSHALENMNRTRTDSAGSRLRLKGGFVDPKHEAGRASRRITKGTFRATEAWTDGRHGTDDNSGDAQGLR